MARINTKDLLKDYILRQLGAPLINVELVEDHLDDVIDATIKEYSSFAFDGELEETVIITVDGSGSYTLPDTIQSVMKVSQGVSAGGLTNFGGNFGAGYVPDIWSEQFFSGSDGITGIMNSIIGVSTTQSMLDTYMGDDLAFDFNAHKKKLRLFEPYSGNLLVYYTFEYLPDSIDYIFDDVWVKKMSVAQSRLLQSTITGKFDQTLIGGGRINYADMRALAQEEIAQLKEDLQLQYAGPAPILIG
ncbi:MAG: hypothetical protein KAI79_10150 [Bacteroidales bacterium]|nr:hypothetical protein [Bacteroidales bacterium]